MSERYDSTPLRSGVRRFGLGAALLLAGLVAPPARADLPSPHRLHREVRAHVHDALSRLGHVPDRIHRRHQEHLRVFFGGYVDHRPHRHRHVVYQFPVWVDGGVYYRPYVYCNGSLYGSYPARPRLWTDWSRDRSGAW